MGDSCWIQEFSNVASLCAGHKLGYTLIKAFQDKQFNEQGLSPYFEWYSKYCFEPHGRRELGAGGSLWDYLTAEELDYLAGLPPEPAPSTLSFWTSRVSPFFTKYCFLLISTTANIAKILTHKKN